MLWIFRDVGFAGNGRAVRFALLVNHLVSKITGACPCRSPGKGNARQID